MPKEERFYPATAEGNYDHVGSGPGAHYTVQIPFTGDEPMTDTEYSLLFKSVVLPVARQYDPDFVLCSMGFDATEGDDLCNYKLSPAMYGHMVQVLSKLDLSHA